MRRNSDKSSALLSLMGIRFWPASVLPALVGTTLPFWLDPPGFRFRPGAAILFLIATVSCHAGFILLHAGFMRKSKSHWNGKRLFIAGISGLLISVLIGVWLNGSLRLHSNVPGYIFTVYGFSMLFVGMLYVAPPFSFHRRVYGEVIICVGLGMLPVLGAYLVQVGDITRTVYLASLPIVVSTGLWLWIIELINRPEDEKLGHRTLVMLFPLRVADRYITLLLSLLIYAALVAAVLGRSSLSPFSLPALLSAGYAVNIVRITWKDYEDRKSLEKAGRYSIFIHLVINTVIIAASLASVFMSRNEIGIFNIG